VLKCLEKDRDRRYESSSALAADLERYLADEAVLACPPSAWYRFRKFARRNKASLLTVTTVLVGLAVSTLLIARAYHEESLQRVLAEKKEREARAKESEANAERLRAEESRKDALAQEKEARDVVDRFLWRVSCDKLLYQPGLQPMRRELLEHALRYYRRYLHKHEYDPAFLAEAATVYCGVGEINRLMGQKAASGQAYEKARAIGEKLVQERPTHAHRKVLALAYLLSGNLFRETGPLEEALRHYRSAVPLYEALVEADPKNLTLQRDRASLYGNMSLVFQRMASPAEALRHQQEAVKLWAHLVQSNGHFQFRADLATAHVQMAGSLINLGRHEQARACTERAVQILAPLVTDSGIAPDLRNALARAYENLGLTCTKARDLDKALAWFEKARAHLDRLVRDNPAVTDYQSSLGRIYFDIGMTHYLANRDQDSLSMLEEARRLQEPLARAHPTVTEYVRDLGLTYHHLGGIQTEPDKQRRYHDLARELQERLLEGDPGLPTLQAELALTYRAIAYSRYPRAGQFSEGRKYYAKAIDLLEQAVRKQPAEFLNRMRLAAVCSEFGALQPEPDEKLRYYDRARAVLEQLRAEFPEEFAVKAALARSYQLIAYWRYKCVGRYPQALEYFERARGLFEEAAKDPTLRAEVGHLKGVYWEIAKGNHLVGMGHVRGGRLNEGIDAFTRGRAVNRTLVERFPDGAEYWRELIVVNVALGVCLQKAGKPKEAEAAYREAVEVLRRAVLGKHIPAADLARDQLFAPLRSREDFQKLVAEVNGKQ